MADDWEDWEDQDFTPTVPSVSTKTKGDLLLGKTDEIDQTQFEGEDEEIDEPAWAKNAIKSEQKKAVPKKTYEDKGVVDLGTPLDDPVKEKLRLARLQEQSDLNAAMESLGGPTINLDTFVPKTQRDFENLARVIASTYIVPHDRNPNFKAFLKTLLKSSLITSESQQVKDIETALAGLRAERLKEKAANASKKALGKKKSINVGKMGGSAGLDDYRYDDDVIDDDDFM